MKPKTIVLTGGGSGGHITPLLSLAHELKKADPEANVAYIGYSGDNFDSLKLSTHDFDFTAFINAGKFRRYHGQSFLRHLLDIKTLILNARDFFRLFSSTAKALRILRKLKPQVVFSKGSFVAVPVGIAARMLGIPIVTHDSDTVPGLANRIIGRWAMWHATGMPAKYYNYPQARTIYTGIPLAPGLQRVTADQQQKLKRQLGMRPSSEVLLVGGAGNGSEALNNLVIAIAPHLLKAQPSLQIIHVAGQRNEPAVKELYAATLPKEELKKVKVYGFSADFNSLSGAADLIISRAGATSLAEFAVQAKACLIIPADFLTGGQQLKNAEELSRGDAAAILNEPVEADELLGVTTELLNDPQRRSQLANNIHKQAKPGAAHTLARLLLDAANGKAS